MLFDRSGGFTLNTDWFRVEKIDDLTYAISEYGHWERVHSFLLMGSETALLIDTGLGIGNIKKVVDRLTALPVKVFTTHYHWDHIGGHKYFNFIAVHTREKKWMESGIPIPLSVIKQNIMKEPFSITPPEDFDIEKYKIYTGKPSKIIDTDEIIDLGKRKIKILHTPGHSPGHLVFFDCKTKVLFTGDLFYKGTIYVNYPSTDPYKYCESLKKITTTLSGLKRIFPSHNELNIPLEDFHSFVKFVLANREKGKIQHGAGILKYNEYSLFL